MFHRVRARREDHAHRAEVAGTVCPACTRRVARRCRRRRLLERVLSVARVSPFRCRACGFRFLAFHPAVTYRRRSRQRRMSERLAIGGSCVLEHGSAPVAGRVVDLSLRGCGVTTAAAPPVGARVGLVVRAEPMGPPLRIATAIVRSVRQDRVGLEFGELREDEATRLGSAILAARGYAPSLVSPRRHRTRRRSAWITTPLARLAALIARA